MITFSTHYNLSVVMPVHSCHCNLCDCPDARTQMSKVMLTVFKQNQAALEFFTKKLKWVQVIAMSRVVALRPLFLGSTVDCFVNPGVSPPN